MGIFYKLFGKKEKEEETEEKYINLGMQETQKRNLEKAEKFFKKAIEISPHSVKAHTKFGIFLYSSGRFDATEKEYSKAIKLDPNYVEAHTGLGLLYAEIGEKRKADEQFEIANHLKNKEALDSVSRIDK